MKHQKSARPIAISAKLKHDRAIRSLLVAWLHLHARFRVCTKRLNWRTEQSRSLEKKRRKEKWQCVARILHIERTLLRWLATSTRHPDLYAATKSGTFSRRGQLYRAYDANRRTAYHLKGDARNAARARRIAIVLELRMLERTWMLALLARVHPTLHPPEPLPLHPSELLPRKIKHASRALDAEVTSPTPITINAVLRPRTVITLHLRRNAA